jgi:cobyrinic acid a,c-diamide synthase
MKINSIIVAAPSSGSGKTTVSMGLIYALKKLGYSVKAFKIGPDYIDSGYQSFVSGNPSDNLDSWMGSRSIVRDIFFRKSQGYDISIIEGVMGLYDGKDYNSIRGSTAEIASILKIPVIIVIDISSMARTAASIINGLKSQARGFRIAGVILNRAGSDYHCLIVKKAIESLSNVKVLGCIKKNNDLSLSSRHLGLIPYIEGYRNKDYLESLGNEIIKSVDLNSVLSISKKSHSGNYNVKERKNRNIKVSIGVAYDRAFNFYYDENLKLLEHYGAEIKYFSPMESENIPDVDGIYIGGGFPEVYASDLEKNKTVLKEIKKLGNDGMPIFAECGGYMYLSKSIKYNNQRHFMAGIIDSDIYMDKLVLGYRTVESLSDNILFKKGYKIRGHEFHYSKIKYNVENNYAYNTSSGPDGFYTENILAGYSHLYFPSNKKIPERFVSSCHKYHKR